MRQHETFGGKTKVKRSVFPIVIFIVAASFMGFLAGVFGQDGSGAQLRKSNATPEPPVYESQEQLREKKRQSLKERAELRAFNGAPPIIPHPIEQRDVSSCAACHTEGVAARNFSIPRMSHKFLVNCTQCHAPLAEPWSQEYLDVKNSFDGVEAPLEGDRAWPGAPPIIPHSTQMRSNCASCHGPGGKPGLRTTHPERLNCLQCHAPSAKLDQHQF